MRYLLFLLLLSGFTTQAQLQSHMITEDCAKSHKGELCARYTASRYDSLAKVAAIRAVQITPSNKTQIKPFPKCSHKWVELHQDTFEVRPIHQKIVTTLLYNPRPQQLDYEFEATVQLICLICHQEKKKVIQYNR